MTLFTVRLKLAGIGAVHLDYQTINECLVDGGLEVLFGDGLIGTCAIYCGDTRITAPPTMSWARFREHLISNSSAILSRGER